MRVLSSTVIATLGASLGGMLGELVARHLGGPQSDPLAVAAHSALWYVALGAALGTSLGAANALWRGSWRLAPAPLLLGAAGGVLGGLAGLLVFYLVVFSADTYSYDAIFTAAHRGRLAPLLLARACSMAVLGALAAGGATPVAQWPTRGQSAALGGGLGGLAAGVAFEMLFVVLGVPQHDSPLFSQVRAMGVAFVGALVGLGSVALAEATKLGELVVLAGICEGRRLPLHRGQNIVGRAPSCQVALPEELTLQPWHAAIVWEVDHFVLHDASGGRTRVNGEVVARSPLKHGDRIRLGNAIFALELAWRVQPAGIAQRSAASVEETPAQPGAAFPTPPAAGEPRYRLRGVRGVLAGREYVLQSSTRTLGRLRSDILLEDPAVSRRHATVEVTAQGVTLRDAGSANGIIVGGRRVQTAHLRPGDEVTLGSTVFVLERAAE